jgi:hypothetical protein
MKFVNSAKAIVPKDWYGKDVDANRYRFENTSPYLFVWSGLFQRIISQAGTYLFTKKFHDHDCGIYKCEGGCRIDDVGDLVLQKNYCYIDGYYGNNKKINTARSKKEGKLADLITHIVLNWNPEDPIESMLKSASEHIKCEVSELRGAIEGSRSGGVFGGNALSSFFDWNPFSKAPIDEKYERWCRLTICKEDKKEVDQSYKDQKLGEQLLEKLKTKCRKAAEGSYASLPMCCSPSRSSEGLQFWINTGRFTQIDGWKTQKEIEQFLKGDCKLIIIER